MAIVYNHVESIGADRLKTDSVGASEIQANAVGDDEIATHTSTKITITAKGQLNSQIAYEDDANIFTQNQEVSKTSAGFTVRTPDGTTTPFLRLIQSGVVGWLIQPLGNAANNDLVLEIEGGQRFLRFVRSGLNANELQLINGNLNLGGNKLKTTNLLLKELDSTSFAIRNAADNADRRLFLSDLFASGAVKIGANSIMIKQSSATRLAVRDSGDTGYNDIAAGQMVTDIIESISQGNDSINLQGTSTQFVNRPISFAANINILGKSQGAAPTTTELPAGEFLVYKETGGGTVKLYYNDAGTIKSVALA